MLEYLSRSISSKQAKGKKSELNLNKLNGLLAEVDFRSRLNSLGFGDRVSPGGWIVRSVGDGNFGHSTAVFFPATIEPNVEYPPNRELPEPPHGLHTICSTFHQIGIAGYYCVPSVNITKVGTIAVQWHGAQLGLPRRVPYADFPTLLKGYSQRDRAYNFLRYNTDTSSIPKEAIAEEFSKELIRIAFQDQFLAEISDVDGIIWGHQYTYPVEIKEKTVGEGDGKTGPYFGLDVGPFVKLAFYAAKRGNLHSLFVVREINNTTDRELVNWHAITFEKLAQFASWVPQPGGTNMMGGGSSTIKVPKHEFSELNKEFLESL